MRNEPGAAALLGLARQVLLTELAPLLPEARRYDLLMVAAAMAIAARELEGAGAAPALERERLLAFFDDAEGPPETEAIGDTLKRLNRQLAAAIRRGEHDGDASLHRLLTDVIEAYLLESNPKILNRPADTQA
jgi:hypothetical protein